MYRIAICDDDKNFLELEEGIVREYCEEKQINAVVRVYNDSDTLVDDIECGKLYDAYILDIEMGGYSGMEIARIIEKQSSMAVVIFLTAYPEYAIEACGMNILRYILKERLNEEFKITLDELFRKLNLIENRGSYLISNQRKFIRISQNDVIYVYKNQKNAVFVLIGGKEENERKTLQEVYNKLNSKEMYFLDRGVILNISHVQKILENQIVMTEGYCITSSTAHIMELKKFLLMYWGDII